MIKYNNNNSLVVFVICFFIIVRHECYSMSDDIIVKILNQYENEAKQEAISINYKDFGSQSIDINKSTDISNSKYDIKITKEKNIDKMAIASLEDGYKAFSMGHYEVALVLYQEALNKSPNNIDIKFGIGASYHKLGMKDKAKDIYSDILKDNPNHKNALNNYIAIVIKENPEDTLNMLRRIEAANPAMDIIPAQISSIYQKNGNYDLALKYMKKAYRIDPKKLEYIYNIGIIFENMNETNNAISVYTKVLETLNNGYKSNINYRDVSNRISKLNNG